MQSISISLGMPRYGWLPFRIKVGDYLLTDEASDLGLNLIDQLIGLIGNARLNQAGECYFYLEPSGYFLKLEPNGHSAFLKVQFVDDFDIKDNQVPDTLYQAKINTHEFINELIMALKSFQELTFGEEDWPIPDNIDFLNNLQ